MRYGLYLLNKTPEKRDDWIYILDHSIEFGKKQCLLILGITLEEFRKNNYKIRHEDMEVLGLDITEDTTGDNIKKSIENCSLKTGIPAQILIDGGKSLNKGINSFISENKLDGKILKTYDVTHAAALILKHQLEDEKAWKGFCTKTAETKRFLIHTELSYLSPPKPRDKSRWLNLEIYVKWAEMILKQKTLFMSKSEKTKFKDKLSWIKQYKSNIKEWRGMLDILKQLQKEVKANGLSSSTIDNYRKSMRISSIRKKSIKEVYNKSIKYLEKECLNIEAGTFLGCSDIIESAFAKYKNFSGKSPMKEIGKAILTIPIFTSKINYAEVKVAMETVSANDVMKWQEKNIGSSLFAKRKEAYLLNR